MILNPTVIYKSPRFVVLNKPAGLLMHQTTVSSPEEETVAAWVTEHFPETKSVGDDPVTRPGIVHRLDKDTSGVIIIARDQEYFEYLKKLFQSHAVKKTYLALVEGKIKDKEGKVDKPIGLKPNTTKRVVGGRRMKDVKEAATEYRVKSRLEYNGREYTLLEVSPLTGRTHQIRVHLAFIGHPVVGDGLYGGKEFPGISRQFLHAESVEFPEAPGKMMKISADLPEELKNALSRLKPR